MNYKANLELRNRVQYSSEDKKAKGTKTSDIKRKFKFEYYKICLEATQFENKVDCAEKMKLT